MCIDNNLARARPWNSLEVSSKVKDTWGNTSAKFWRSFLMRSIDLPGEGCAFLRTGSWWTLDVVEYQEGWNYAIKCVPNDNHCPRRVSLPPNGGTIIQLSTSLATVVNFWYRIQMYLTFRIKDQVSAELWILEDISRQQRSPAEARAEWRRFRMYLQIHRTYNNTFTSKTEGGERIKSADLVSFWWACWLWVMNPQAV